MPEYSPNLNIEKALGTENVNRAYFMRVIDDIDEKVGVANGLAKLDANGNVLKADGTQAGEVTKTQFETHTGLAATTLKVGHVQLSDAVTSTDVTKAATSNAVKKAYDRADAAFTSASNGKATITNAVTGADSRVVVPADPTFAQLATAIGQIQTGKKWASGTANATTINGYITVTVQGLDFTPSLAIARTPGSSTADVTQLLLIVNNRWQADYGNGKVTGGYFSPQGSVYTITANTSWAVTENGFSMRAKSTGAVEWLAVE